jgi:hypothetical protein
MRIAFPALNLKAKLILLMVVLLALTLGAEVVVSLSAEEGQGSCQRYSDQRKGTYFGRSD